MADYVHPDVLDTGLTQLTSEIEMLHICSQQPASYAEVATYSLGTKANPTITGPTNGDASGRKVTIATISDGAVNTTGTAGWIALVNNTDSKLWVAADLGSTQAVTSGNPFTLTETDITIPAPTT